MTRIETLLNDAYPVAVDEAMLASFGMVTETTWNVLAGPTGAYSTSRKDGEPLSDTHFGFLDGYSRGYTDAQIIATKVPR